MKRTFAIILAAVAAAALFGGLVHVVLVAAHLSEPAATTVYGMTPRRLWAGTVAVVALVGVVIGGLALARPASRFGTASGRLGAIAALVAGLNAPGNSGGDFCSCTRGSRPRPGGKTRGTVVWSVVDRPVPPAARALSRLDPT